MIDFKHDYYLKSRRSIYILEHLDSVKKLVGSFNTKLKYDHRMNEKKILISWGSEILNGY